MEWQPITTAPHDGTPVLLLRLAGEGEVQNQPEVGSFRTSLGDPVIIWRTRSAPNGFYPTHWARLPRLPHAGA